MYKTIEYCAKTKLEIPACCLFCQLTGLLVNSHTVLHTIRNTEIFIIIEMSKETELRLSHSVSYIVTHIWGGDLSLAQDFIASGYSLVHWPGFGHSFHYDSSGWSICSLCGIRFLAGCSRSRKEKGGRRGGSEG